MIEDSEDVKACPFCAETIKSAAIVCKHCGRDLPQPKTQEQLDMERLGIRHEFDRYQWRGNFFKNLSDAIAYAESAPPVLGQQLGPISDQQRDSGKPFKWWLWGPLGAVGAFLVWAMVRTPSPEEVQRRRDRFVIEQCWEDQKRKSLDPSAARFVAKMCENFEDDFRKKWNTNP